MMNTASAESASTRVVREMELDFLDERLGMGEPARYGVLVLSVNAMPAPAGGAAWPPGRGR